MAIKGTTLLSCGCWKDYGSNIPALGDEVSCRLHGSATRVNETHYSIRCQTCPYSKPNEGNAPLTVHVLATKHSVTRRHPVKITKYHNNKIIETEIIGGERDPQLDLDLGDVG